MVLPTRHEQLLQSMFSLSTYNDPGRHTYSQAITSLLHADEGFTDSNMKMCDMHFTPALVLEILLCVKTCAPQMTDLITPCIP